MGLLPARIARVAGGSIRFKGTDLLTLDEDAKRDLRGNRLAMIFQEPMTSLNPAFTIGEQIMEGLIRPKKLNREQARPAAIAILRQVRIPPPQHRSGVYQPQLSRGMPQRPQIPQA